MIFQEHIFGNFGINGVSISDSFDDEGLCFRHMSRDIDMSEGLQNPKGLLKVLANDFDSSEFFVGLVFDTSYYSELWLINMGNLADKIWYDIYDRNTTMDGYDKFIGDNFNLEEFKETFFDKFTGIQRTAQIYYDKSYQMDGDKYYIHCTVLVIDSACVMERWNPSILDQYYGTVLFIRYNHLQCLLIIFKAFSDEQENKMVRILEINRSLLGFNITIFLFCTSRSVDMLITESEIQMALMALTAPAN